MGNTFENYVKSPLEIENTLLKLFDKNSEIIIFDIGACEGEDSIRYSNLFPDSKIFAFEPLSANIKKIESNILKYKKTNISLYPTALSNAIGFSPFYVSSGSPAGQENNLEWDFGNKSSSLLRPDKVKQEFDWLKFNSEIRIPTDTLINFCITNNIGQIDFIHLDVQGAELDVLKGAGNYINKIKSIWLEVEKISLYENQPLKRDVELFMKANGFVKIIDTVGNISGDQFYVNNQLAEGYHSKRKPFSKLTASIKQKLNPAKINVGKLSYSQSGEDLIVDFIFTQMGVSNPSYLDIGAHHPFYLSNTAFFYEKGCEGINIEPDPALFKLFPVHRSKDININCGIGKEDGELVLNIMNVPALNTFMGEEAERLVKENNFKIINKLPIPIQSIQSIVQKYKNGTFPDFLSIDVEGLDDDIIKSIDFNRFKPIVICLETISYAENGRGEKNNAIITYLENKGYLKYADTNINTIFVLREKWYR
ncbi:MAG: hypothetical protein JWQ66_4439 [Mucilaginibacter sp.]|nr:hypothetical protein [Mucilaginibacter sp.]